MPINFPTSPATDDIYTYAGRVWKYNGVAWESVSSAYGPVGPEGPANVLTVGTVTAGSTGTAEATITGTTPEQVLNLVLPKGDDGADGKSAYQSAVDNGFTGTESEWIDILENTVAGIRVTVADTAPTSPNVGDLWFW